MLERATPGGGTPNCTHVGFLQKLYWMPATARGMRGGDETAYEAGASPDEFADDFVFDTYMSLYQMDSGNVGYGVTNINRLREGLAPAQAFPVEKEK